MSNLRSTAAAVVGNEELSLHDVLYTLKLKGQLEAILQEAIAERLIAAAAKEQGLTVSPEEKQRAADRYRRGLGLDRADATQEWLAVNQMSPEDMETGLTRVILQQKLIAAIPPRRIQQYFTVNRDRFERAGLSRIVLPKKDLAEELLAQLKDEGKDFAEMARQHSTDGRTKKAGGRMGVVPRKSLPANVEKAVFQAKAGDVLGPFEQNGAFHLVKVDGLLPARLTPRLAALIRRRLFTTWLRGKAKAANIQVKLHEHM